jgi:zinc transport system substrate-binding protein
VAVLAAVGCGGGHDGEGTIVAAFYPLAFAAERLAPGEDVATLTPAGVEPHDLELTPRDVERLRDAKLVLYVGGGFMPALEDAVSDQENAVDLLDGADHSGDPHVWLAPLRYARMVERIAGELGDPEAATALVADLEELDAEFRAALAACEQRQIVTSHAAFGHLAAAYDLEQIALTGIAPEAEPSARALEKLIDEVESAGATTVFVETLVSSDLAETIARETGAKTAVLNPLEGLTEDEAEAGADYFSVMRENLAALREALGCS